MNTTFNQNCKYCNKQQAQFYSICVSCNEGIKEACINCFKIWRNRHPTRPFYTSINKWNGQSHLVDNWDKLGFIKIVEKNHPNKILESL